MGFVVEYGYDIDRHIIAPKYILSLSDFVIDFVTRHNGMVPTATSNRRAFM